MYWQGHRLLGDKESPPKDDNYVKINVGGMTVKYAIGNGQVDLILSTGSSIERTWNATEKLNSRSRKSIDFYNYLDTLGLEQITLNLLKDIYATEPRM
jgi:hypothetical protein